jgi:hypothetical protein
MKVYTSIEYKMTDEGLEEVASESYEYHGAVAETKGGGAPVNNYYYYGQGGPGAGEPNPEDAVGITGEAGAPNLGTSGIASLNPADTTAGMMPSGYASGATPTEGTMVPTAQAGTVPNAIAPTISYTNPYELMNTMQAPPGVNQV